MKLPLLTTILLVILGANQSLSLDRDYISIDDIMNGEEFDQLDYD